MSHNGESQTVRKSTHTVEDDARKASDVNAGKPGSRTKPEGSGDRDEAAIETSRDKLEQAGGGH